MPRSILTRDKLHRLDLPSYVKIPDYDLRNRNYSVVHFGPGDFFLSHGGTIFDEIRHVDDRWGVRVVSIRTPEMVKALKAHDWLYVMMERAGGKLRRAIINASIVKSTYGGEPGKAYRVADAIANASTKLLTFTITNVGYHANSSLTGINTNSADVVHDLTRPFGMEKAKTVFPYLTAGLGMRMYLDEPLTMMSLDNFEGNSRVLRESFLGYLQQAGLKDLASWVSSRVAFPCTCVDRITPEQTDETRAEASAALGGVEVGVAVTAESYRQLVVERSPYDTPPWEVAGVEVVDDCSVHSRRKLVALNWAHQVGAHPAVRAGEGLFHRAMTRAHKDEPSVNPIAALVELAHREYGTFVPDVDDYAASVRSRFADDALAHETQRITCSAAATKIGPRLLAAVEEVLNASAGTKLSHASIFAASCWLLNITGNNELGVRIHHRDENVPKLVGPATLIRDWVEAVAAPEATHGADEDEDDDVHDGATPATRIDMSEIPANMQVLASNFAQIGQIVGDDRFVRLATNRLFINELAWCLINIYKLGVDDAILALLDRIPKAAEVAA